MIKIILFVILCLELHAFESITASKHTTDGTAKIDIQSKGGILQITTNTNLFDRYSKQAVVGIFTLTLSDKEQSTLHKSLDRLLLSNSNFVPLPGKIDHGLKIFINGQNVKVGTRAYQQVTNYLAFVVRNPAKTLVEGKRYEFNSQKSQITHEGQVIKCRKTKKTNYCTEAGNLYLWFEKFGE